MSSPLWKGGSPYYGQYLGPPLTDSPAELGGHESEFEQAMVILEDTTTTYGDDGSQVGQVIGDTNQINGSVQDATTFTFGDDVGQEEQVIRYTDDQINAILQDTITRGDDVNQADKVIGDTAQNNATLQDTATFGDDVGQAERVIGYTAQNESGTSANQTTAYGTSANQTTAYGTSANQTTTRGRSVNQTTTHGTSANQTTAYGNAAQRPSNKNRSIQPLPNPTLAAEDKDLPAPSQVKYLTEPQADKTYHKIMKRHGFQPKRATSPKGTNENNYIPQIWDEDIIPKEEGDPEPLYPAYSGRFQTREAAREYRKRSRIPPRAAPDLDLVRRHGRKYWAKRIYEAMIDRANICDKLNSKNRQRFDLSPAFEQWDLEATAHHIFDCALAVHERGFSRPKVYHKKAVRGKLEDISKHSVERRLSRICFCLSYCKAIVDDAMHGGVPLALLCDNPEARIASKESNNTGNTIRSTRLQLAKKVREEQEEAAEKEKEKKGGEKDKGNEGDDGEGSDDGNDSDDDNEVDDDGEGQGQETQ